MAARRAVDDAGVSPRAYTDRASLAKALEEEEARVRRLDAERADARARADALRATLAALDDAQVAAASGVASPFVGPCSASEKVALFRQLFRGRDDLYPTRFVSKKTGKPGYAPACSNKWVPGLCVLKTGGKCSDCTNQAFLPVDEAALLLHLRGKHVMGIYPLLADETCWFLAADFDKTSWKEDVHAFVETARRLGLPALVERSRSGNGAHVWFFFAAPVPAHIARKMGCHLITETMAVRHELSMESYDRLFPSQDTMPRGGFGNLIALPLQHEPRRLGNSVFLDDHLNAYPDDQQWAVLASAKRISPAAVERIVSEAERRGTIVGLRHAEALDDDDASRPWTRPPSGTPRIRRISGPMPSRVAATRGRAERCAAGTTRVRYVDWTAKSDRGDGVAPGSCGGVTPR
jgi:hypothetical protein